MCKKIKVQIYGYQDEFLGGNTQSCGCGGGCSGKAGDKASGCGGCGSRHRGDTNSDNEAIGNEKSGCGGCGSKVLKTTGEYYEELTSFIENSDVSKSADIEFMDLKKINILDYDNIRTLDELGYEAPYVVIDDIVRFYGGISNELVYKDVKELLED